MDNNQNVQFDFYKTINILLRRKWLIIGIGSFAIALALAFNHFSTSVYQASTTIVFEELESPTASISPFKISFNKNFIIKQLEEIESLSLAKEVVKFLPYDITKTFSLPEKPMPGFDREEYIAKEINKRVSAGSVNNSEVIKIDVEAYTPQTAKVIANTFAQVLKKRKLDVKREETSKVREIIEDQLVAFKKQLDNAEIALKEFKEQSKVTVIDREAEEIYKRITEAEIKYNQAKADFNAAKKRFALIQKKLADERQDLVPTITKITSPWAQKLKQQLVDLEVQYTTLKLQDYSDDHPKMKRLRTQIQETKNNLKQESMKIASGENIVDPISQIEKFMEESIALEIEIQTYAAQEKALRRVIDNYKKNLNTMPDKELRLAQLMRDKDVNEKIYTMLLQKREEAKIVEAEKVGNIRIIDPASTPEHPIKPKKALNLIIAIVLSFVISMGLIFFLEYIDKTIKTVEEAEQITNLNILGTIPHINFKNIVLRDKKLKGIKEAINLNSNLVTKYNPKSAESEFFRNLKANLQIARFDSPFKTIMITSANPGEGKSFISSNLSITTAQMGLRTLLIDADLKKPVLHTTFHKRKEPGLVDFLLSKNEINNDPLSINNEVNWHQNLIMSTGIENLDILVSGSSSLNSSGILASSKMKELLDELKHNYDIIFIDTPPINIIADGGIINSIGDGSILVIKANGSTSSEIKNAIKLLRRANDNILGIVLNSVDLKNGYYSKYYHYYFDNNNGNIKQEQKNAYNLAS